MNKKMGHAFLAIVLAVVAFTGFGCGAKPAATVADRAEQGEDTSGDEIENFEQEKESSLPIKVTATIFPQYDFIRQIGGDYVQVEMLIPPGEQIHQFVPTELAISDIYESALFVYTGSEIEPWVRQIVEGNDGSLRIVNLSEGILERETNFELPQELEQKEEADRQDGHIWLDMSNAVKMADAIALALMEVDPQHGDYYRQNGEKLKAELQELDQEFEHFFKANPDYAMVFASPFAYQYFTRRYGVNYMTLYEDCTAASVANTEKLNEIHKFIQQNHLRYQFADLLEASVAPLAEGMISKPFYAAHTVAAAQMARDITFVDLMKENISSLKSTIAE